MRRSLWIVLLFVALAPRAHADSSFAFTATPSVPGSISASGIITAEYVGTYLGTPGYLATGMTGTIDGNTITGVLPPGSISFGLGLLGHGDNSNFVYGPPDPIQVIQVLGFTDSAGDDWIVAGFSSTYYELQGFDSSGNVIPGADVYGDFFSYSVTLTPITATTPEPSVALLMLAGVGLLLVIRRWRTPSHLGEAS